jgi:hypothetical protein
MCGLVVVISGDNRKLDFGLAGIFPIRFLAGAASRGNSQPKKVGDRLSQMLSYSKLSWLSMGEDPLWVGGSTLPEHLVAVHFDEAFANGEFDQLG